MKKKKTPPSLSPSRRIELLSHYYRIDQEKRVVYVELRFQKATDLLEEDCGIKENPMFSSSILEKIGSIYEQIPADYFAEIEFEIEDYEGYEPASLLEKFNEALELNNYQRQKSKRKKWLQAVLLTLAGIAVLAFMGVASVHHWFGEAGSESEALWIEVFDIAGWVFVWEAVTVLFLEPNPLGVLGLRILSRTSGIRFLNKGSKEVLAEENGRGIVAKWEGESALEKSSKIALLLSSTAFLAIGVGSFFSSILYVLSSSWEAWKIGLFLGFSLFSSVFDILAGASGIQRYLGRGKLRKLSLPFAIVIFLQLSAYIFLSLYLWDAGFTAQAVLTTLIQAAFVFGVITNTVKSKKAS